MALTLRLKNETTIPISLRGIVPTRLAVLKRGEIDQLPVNFGNRDASLADIFHIDGDIEDGVLVLSGDLPNVNWIGSELDGGRIEVKGSVGHYLAAQMTGGEVAVHGSAGDYVGSEMLNGHVRVSGNVGNGLGAALPGSAAGMRGGVVTVGGNTGQSTGFRMRRGSIVVAGDCGSAAGWEMLAGTLAIGGLVGPNCGREMIRGTIMLTSKKDARDNMSSLPVTFSQGGVFQSVFMNLLSRQFRDVGFEDVAKSPFRMFHGDHLKGGRGEVFLPV